jgi:diguanylate cyclase (GGDEF)-like protein
MGPYVHSWISSIQLCRCVADIPQRIVGFVCVRGGAGSSSIYGAIRLLTAISMDEHFSQSDTAIAGQPTRRRNRDHPLRGGAVGSIHALALTDPITDLPPQHVNQQAQQTVESGLVWLRFPAALEAEFQAEHLEPRLKLLRNCGVIGIVAICIGSLQLRQLMPDVADVALRSLWWILAITGLSLLQMWATPQRWRRSWQAEAVTTLSILALNAGLLYDFVLSHIDTTFTHSAALVTSVLYACIGARLRFAWALTCSLITFGAFVVLVTGTTPLQEVIVTANAKLMALSYVFGLLVNYAFEHSERRNWLLRRLEQQQRAALKQASENLRRLSIQDSLTGLFNRRQFESDLDSAWSKATLASGPVGMLMLDVDFFKRYNDTYGHPAGDTCLIRVSQAIAKVAKGQDGIAARLGGEEFGLLLPGRTVDEAVAIGEALCRDVKSARIEHCASSVAPHVTVSIGAAHFWPAQGGGKQLLVDAADRALYQAKEAGRDRCCGGSAEALAEVAATAAAKAVDPTTPCEPKLAAITESAPLPEQPESAYIQILNGGFRKLRFPPQQESAFRSVNTEHRRKVLALTGVLGLVIYNIYTLSSRAMLPDVQGGVFMMQIWLSLTFMAVAVAAYFLRVSLFWRETYFSMGTAVVGIMTAWVISQSQQLTAIAYSVCLVLIPMFSGVAARQPFWFTCVPALATCIAAMVFLRPVGAVQTLVASDSVVMIATNTLFTLILAYTLEYGARKGWLLTQIERLQGEALQAASRRLHDLSVLDPLTGISNRRHFEDTFHRAWTEAEMNHRHIAVLVIDVDFFKLYNDGYGHPVGDRCLKQVAAIINETAYAGNAFAARLGGEEFGILLLDADKPQAVQMGECICAAVSLAGIEHRYSRVPGQSIVTVSVGSASLAVAKQMNWRALYAIADDALYQAKKDGRNRVAYLSQPTQPLAEALLPHAGNKINVQQVELSGEQGAEGLT